MTNQEVIAAWRVALATHEEVARAKACPEELIQLVRMAEAHHVLRLDALEQAVRKGIKDAHILKSVGYLAPAVADPVTTDLIVASVMLKVRLAFPGWCGVP